VNIYFFGGSFDPPHRGHLKIIQTCANKCQKFIIIPAKKSPFKDQIPGASGFHRIRMLELLISKIEYPIYIEDCEINNPSPSYTFDTIRHLQKNYPISNLYMIVGADQLARFHRWKNYREIMDIVKIIAFNRSQNNFKPPKGMNISWIADFKIDISSTKIRNKIATGNLPVEDLTSEILDYIQANKLYESKS